MQTCGRRLASTKMCFRRRAAGLTLLDHERNEETMRDLQIPQLTVYRTVQKKVERTH
jgi:hypothetical protein